MFTRIGFLSLVCLLAPAALAQVHPVDKGTSADLRGAKTVFVDAGVSRELRDAIVADLRRELPELSVVDRADDAALVVQFSTSIGPDTPLLERHRVDRSTMVNRTNTDRLPSPPGSRVEDRLTTMDQPEIVRATKSGKGSIDELAPTVQQPRAPRYAVGSVLRPTGTDRFVEPLSFKRRIGDSSDGAMHAFVRKFAKAYRKANAPTS